MSKNTVLVALAAVVAIAGVLSGKSSTNDVVHQAFVRYEAEWRRTNGDAANGLESGDLKTDTDVHDWIAKQQPGIRKDAFSEIAKTENEQIGGGKWTAEKHAKILRGWAGGQ